MRKNTIILDEQLISINDVVEAARSKTPVELSGPCWDKICNSNTLVDKFVDEARIVYGVTTGFGKNLNYVISRQEASKLQENIVLSHSVTVGEPLSEELVRAFMFAVLVNLRQGFSGTSPEVVRLIQDMLNANIIAYAPCEGHIGSLANEAFIALALIGEGQAYYEGELLPSAQALAKAGLSPVRLGYKDGLSVITGSTLASAMAALAIHDLKIAAKNLQISAALTFEALRGNLKAFDERLHSLKKHPEQLAAARIFNSLLNGSEILSDASKLSLQDPVLLRVAAHVHGSAISMIKEAEKAVVNEINSVSDNPVIYPLAENDAVGLMGGNFDSSYISLYCDSAALAASMLGKIADKRVDRLNYGLEHGLPPFLTGKPGLNNGYMIPQYTVAGLFSEISFLSMPVSVQSISTCAGHESPVTMATLAARRLLKIASKLQYIAAIELMMAAQAIELRAPEKPSPVNCRICDEIRKQVKPLIDDRYYHDDIMHIFNMVKNGSLVKIAEQELKQALL